MKKLGMVLIMMLAVLTLVSCKGNGDMAEGGVAGESDSAIPDFKVKDIDGKSMKYKDLKDYDLLVVSLWGGFCEEKEDFLSCMDDLQDNYQDESVKVIGIIVDEDTDEAIEFLKENDIGFTNLIPDKSLERELISNFEYVPVTLYIDGDGKLVTMVEGVLEYDDYDSVVSQFIGK